MLNFERKAKENIKLTWGHGKYADPWTLLHGTVGISAGIATIILHIPLWQALTATIFVAFLYEAWEAVQKIVEDIQNVLFDIVAVAFGMLGGFFLFFNFHPKTLLVFLLASLLLNFILLFKGWHAYLKKRLQVKMLKHLYPIQTARERKNNLRDNVIFFGSALATVPVPLLFQFDPKMPLIWVAFVFLLCAYTIYKEKVGQEMVVAFFFALWITSYHIYIYEGQNVTFGNLNLFPLILWTTGLVLLRELYERYAGRHKLLFLSLLYLFVLFLIEYIGYYVLGIHLQGNYPSLFGLGIIHGPLSIQLFYLFAGPVYLTLTDYLNVK